MKQDLTLNVGTKYDGDGMKKLDNALKNSARTVGAAGRAIGSVSSELQQLGGKAGQAAGAVSGLFSTLMAGGPLALVVAGIGVAVGAIVKAFQDAKEKAKDAADAFRDSFSNAVKKVVDRISAIKSALSFNQKQNSIDQAFAQGQNGVAFRQSQNDIKNKYAIQKANAKTDLERAQIDAAEKRDLAIDTAKFQKIGAEQQVNDLKKNAETLAKAYARQSEEVDKQTKNLTTQRTAIENDPLQRQYDKLKKTVQDTEKVVKEKGKDAVVDRIETVTSMTAGNGMTVNQKKTIEVTAQKRYEDAVATLNKFTKSDEGAAAVKDFESYQKNLNEWCKQNADLAKTSQDLQAANKAVIVAQKSKAVADEEYNTAVKAAEQQYKDDIKNAEKIQKQKDEQAKKQKETEQKQLDAAKKQAEQELEAAKKQAAQEEKQARRQQLQDELDKLTEQQRKTAMQQLNEHRAEAAAAKELAEAEKKAKSILDDWADNKKQDAGAWGREQDAAAKARMEQYQQEAKNLQKAKNTANELGKQLFGANGLRAGANTDQLAKFAQMSDYLGAGNVTQTQRDTLQGAAEKLRAKVFDANGNLKVSRASKDLKNLQRIEQLLGKMDAQDKAKQLQAQQKQREEQRARIAEQQYQAVKDIRDKMKNLGV